MKFFALCLALSVLSCATYTTKHGLQVHDKANATTQEQVEAATDMLLEAINSDGEGLDGVPAAIYKRPLCQYGQDKDGKKTTTIADGYMMHSYIPLLIKDTILVSTIRGCFDGLVHEMAHTLHPNKDRNHSDKKYWSQVYEVVKWTRVELCGVSIEYPKIDLGMCD